jgi:uncharacterized protein
MPDIAREDEPTTEEIFASIRRMIAHDTDAGSAPNAAPGRIDGQASPNRKESDGSFARPAPRITPLSDTCPPMPSTAAPYEPTAKVVPERLAPDVVAPGPMCEGPTRLISEKAAATSMAALSELVAEIPRGIGSVMAPQDDHTLEFVTRELLKRLIKAWLDAKLPSLVESIVRDEIRQLVRAATSPGQAAG